MLSSFHPPSPKSDSFIEQKPKKSHHVWKAMAGRPGRDISLGIVALCLISPQIVGAPAVLSAPLHSTSRAPVAIVKKTNSSSVVMPRVVKKGLPLKEASARGIPRRLVIASAGIDGAVQDVGLLPDGKLDVPADGKNLGWYTLGARPGDVGTAIIDGHLDTAKGPGTFWTLSRVKPGDSVSVIDQTGATRTFRVTSTALYNVEHAPLSQIFGSDEKRRLNLITCAGVWSTRLNHYDKRLVVFTVAIDAVPVIIVQK